MRLKGWLLTRIIAIIDHFLRSEPYREALKQVVKKNRYYVREILDVWAPLPGQKEYPAVPAKEELEEAALRRALARWLIVESPEVSIIIPAYNKSTFTYRCLRSVLTSTISVSFEIIVVDNASKDNTPYILEEFKNCIRLISNKENRGFGEACNQGAGEARGSLLLFLNNDTEVTGNWLDSMVEGIKLFNDAGAVGAKLIYPDGRLQEAGGVVFNNGIGANYGRGGDPEDLKYNYLREVDYCSAACLLVKKELFERLGGFDPRFAPAYYEDSDICFGLRSLGYKVLYQPGAEVVHFEGATAGTDTNSGFKKFQELNRVKFINKWKVALAGQSPPDPASIDLAADRRKGARVLVIDWQVPKYDQDSGSLRMFTVLKLLSGLGCRVSFMLRWGAPFDKYAKLLGIYGIRTVPEKDVNTFSSKDYDLIILSRMGTAELYLKKLKKFFPNVPIIFDTVDLNFIREIRQAETSVDKKARTAALKHKEAEIEMAKKADLVVAITPADRELLLKEAPELRIEVMPNVHYPVNIRPSFEGREALMFIGGFAHEPNVDATVYFVREILPLINKELQGVKFLIVGSSPPDEIVSLASELIIVTGYVPDTAPYFKHSRVFVSPLRYGSGMKGKIGEAMSHGVPVVTTSIGAEGMGLVHEKNALVLDDPHEFASGVVRLYKDSELWMRLATEGQTHVIKNFGPDAARGALDRVLSSILAGAR